MELLIQLLLLSSGIIIGVLLSVLAFLAGKKIEIAINQEKKPIPSQKKAEIIKIEDPFEEFLK